MSTRVSPQILLAWVTVRHRKRTMLVHTCPQVPVRASFAFSTNQAEICSPLPWKSVSFLSLSLSCWTDDCWNWFPSFLIFIFRRASPLLSVKFYLYHPLLSTRLFLTQPALLCFGSIHHSERSINYMYFPFSVRSTYAKKFHKCSKWGP